MAGEVADARCFYRQVCDPLFFIRFFRRKKHGNRPGATVTTKQMVVEKVLKKGMKSICIGFGMLPDK